MSAVSSKNEKLIVIIPAYNEKDNILSVINEWHKVVLECGTDSILAVFNDGSTDNTSEIIAGIQERYPRLVVINKRNSGHGPTIRTGYEWALNNDADFVFQTDSDGQTKSSEFYDFWKLKDDYSAIFGNRTAREDGCDRIIVTKVLKAIVWLIFGTYVPDSNVPFRLIQRDCLKKYLKLIPEDFFLTNVLLAVCITKGEENIKWIPITFQPRQGGKNSINLKKIVSIGIKSINAFAEQKNKIDSIKKNSL